MVMLSSSCIQYMAITAFFQPVLNIQLDVDPKTQLPILTVSPLFRLSIDQNQHPIWRIESLDATNQHVTFINQIRHLLCQLLESALSLQQIQIFNILLAQIYPKSYILASDLISSTLPYVLNHTKNPSIDPPSDLIKIQYYLQHYFTHCDILRWYFICYQHFNPRTYHLFSQWVLSALDDLKRWENEHPNRLAWFLLTQDLNHVDQPHYFRYRDFIHYQYLGEALFESIGQIQQFFALPIPQFKYILTLIFSSEVQHPYFAKVLIQCHLKYNLPILNPMQLWQMRSIFPAEKAFFTDYLNQYAHALYLIIQLLLKQKDQLYLHDFVFGMQIQGTYYSDQPNIALIHSKMTLNSLLKHSKKWHQQSQYIDAVNLNFEFSPYQFQYQDCVFKLICDVEQLQAEAHIMQHCILSYAQRIAHQAYFCFQVHTPNFRGTLGLIYHSHEKKYEFHQIVGALNQAAPPLLHHLAQKFCQYLNLKQQKMNKNTNYFK